MSAAVDIIETVFIELVPLGIVVGCVYRPPSSDVAICTAYIESLLSKLNKEKKLLYCKWLQYRSTEIWGASANGWFC